LGISAASAAPVPTHLPRPDSTEPAKNKPVKVYILSGQSNMVGFGRVTGSGPVYSSIYLSADPSVMPCKMPVGSSALLPHRVYQDKTGDAAGAEALVYKGGYDAAADYAAMKPVQESALVLGTVAAELPAVKGPHTVVVKAFVEVPISGAHELHAGFGESTHAIVTLDGEEVYRKEVGGEEVVTKVDLESGKRYPISITYLKGGSAAFWMELVDLKGRGDLESLVKDEGKFAWMMDEKGEWTVRNDVVLCESYLDANKFKGGRSTALTATANGKHIGPEMGFGYVMGTFHDEPVLLIKSDIGNRSLAWDCLPPGSERYEVDGMIHAGYKDSPDKWAKGTEPTPIGWYAGKQYDEYTQAIRGVLDNFDTLYPQYRDQGYEVAGFVWWQGHKDQNPVHASRYEENMANLIKAWRKEFKAPDAKWVLATIAFGGWDLGEPGKTVAEAQLAVSGDSGRHPEFKGNVKTVEARGFWRTQAESPTGTGYHYNHNAETYYLVGDALGRAMVELEGGKAAPGPVPPRPATVPRTWPENPSLAEAAEMVYADAFVSPWLKGEAEPTADDFAAMVPALRPFVLGKLAPAYMAEAPKVPAYRRHGMSITPIITQQKPEKPGIGLISQYDKLLSYYNAAGVHEYDWKPFGPAMQKASWAYYSFDPPEQQEKTQGGRNRPITYPEGMEKWYDVEFDAKAAGWRSGSAPFGQRDGALAALRENCSHSQCGCDVTPATLWDKEVLLIRQSFEIPEIKDDQRYRLVLGGGSHAFSGEGYAIYVNGKLFAEAKGGHYKGKGGARGGYIYSDFLPEFEKGRVTIAVKAFLRSTGHRNKLAHPTGHISLWLESAKLPKELLPKAPRLSSKKEKKKILPANAKILQVAGHKGYLALPEGVKVGQKTPWLWYFPSDYNLPGKLEQWMMNKCLANGIAVAGINLMGDFGTPAGRKSLTAFYEELTENHGLTKKACLLARSYGGVQMYNWAAEHPESVACLAGIYPVCNMASYPGLKSAAGKYRMSQEQFTKELKQHNPIDRLAPLAKAKVPIYHNTGDIDELVPAKDNSMLLAERYKALGGDITISVFKGQGHNYWPAFFEEKAMAEFVIEHGKKAASVAKVLIFGDSISGGYGKSLTKLLDGKAEVVKLGAVAGYRIQTETFWHSRGTAKNLDFGSAKACIADFDRFERHLEETKYDVIHFNFGLNDIFRGRNGAWHNPVDQYAKDLTKIVTLLKSNGAKVIWASTTPIPANAPHNPEDDDLIYNAAAEKVMKENNIPINDLHSVVTSWDGYAEWRKGDDVHFSGAVYAKLAEQIAEVISAQLEPQENPAKQH